MQNLGNLNNQYTLLSKKYEHYRVKAYSAIHNQNHNTYIIEFRKNEIPANEINILNILNNANNPNILRFIENGNGLLTLNNKPPKNKHFIIFEDAPKFHLFDYIQNNGFSERHAKFIFKKILNGIRAIHNANICHRNINSENILFDENYNPKIYGFYFSCLNANNLQQFGGNQNYLAPEILRHMPYDGKITDIFTLGHLLFTLVSGHFGFNSSNDNDIYYSLIKMKQYPKYWDFISKSFGLNLTQSFKNLFVRMVAYIPNERPSVEEILNDEWMQEINNLNNEQMIALGNEVRNVLLGRENKIQNHLNEELGER